MTTIQIPKHQLLDYVSKRDFNDFVAEMRDFRDETGSRFDTNGKRFDVIDKRFNVIEQRLDGIDIRLGGIDKRLSGIDKRFNDVDKKFDELKEIIRVQTGAILDQFREDLKVGLEYVQNVDNKKVDLIEFEKLKEKVNIILSSKTKPRE
jgi:archaellum component FlaC